MTSFIKPIVWREKERLGNEIVDCITIILRTRGCRWNSCYMCSYTKDAYPASEEELRRQIDFAFERCESEVVKVFTSGSFFDDEEIPPEVRDYLIEKVRERGIKKLIVESRPEFIQEERLENFKSLNLEVGIGLESADDRIRDVCINKGFSFDDFLNAAKLLRNLKIRVKCYLLLKPPFLSEKEAIGDVLQSIDAVKDVVDVVSLNLMNVQKGTLVERLWKAKLYRPPWLWSAVEILKTSAGSVDIICDPVAAGKVRGPHNCGKCDFDVSRAIRNFSLTQNVEELEGLSCSCMLKWKRALELESFARVPLF